MLTANSIDDGIGLPRYCSCLFIVHRLSPVHLIILMTDHISAYVSQRQMNWKAFFLKVGTRTKRMMGIRTLSLNLLFLFCSLTLRSKWSWKYNAKPKSVRKIHLTVLTFPTAGEFGISTCLLFWESKAMNTCSQAGLEKNVLKLCHWCTYC